MIERGRHGVLGVAVDAIDLEAAVERTLAAARAGEPTTLSALAVHGLMCAVGSRTLRRAVDGLDLVVPDGQPVRWALNWLYGAALQDRVFGPALMRAVCERAAEEGLPIYLLGSTERTLGQLRSRLEGEIPGLRVAGVRASRFRPDSDEERESDLREIAASGARILFVGLGAPRQEAWLAETRGRLPLPALAVGAAFDYHAGNLKFAPRWMQRYGLEWLYRLAQEPRRLWRRYLLLNPAFLALLVLQLTGLKRWPAPRTTCR